MSGIPAMLIRPWVRFRCAADPAPRDGTSGQRRINYTHFFVPIFIPIFLMPYDNNGFSPPTSDEISFCAYLIWEHEGRPPGREKEHWFQAETQLLTTRAHDGWTGKTEPAAALHNSSLIMSS